MKHTPLAALFLALAFASCATAEEPAKPASTPAEAKPAAQPAGATDAGALSQDEQRQIRNARARANRLPEVAAALKAENDAYKSAGEAKDAKKPKAEVDALYAKARDLRAKREKMRDDAILAENPSLKPLVERAAARSRASGRGEAPAPKAAPAPERKPEAKPAA